MATIQVNPNPGKPASAASELAAAASAIATARTPAQAGAEGPTAVRGADEEHAAPVAISPAAHRIAFATVASLPVSTPRTKEGAKAMHSRHET